MYNRAIVASPLVKKSSLWLFGLILLYWFTRLHAIDNLAYFIDESSHLWWARLAWQGAPLQAASDGRLLNVLWMALFWPFNAGVWTSRVSGVLITTIGIACLGDTARRIGSTRAGALAVLCYTFMPLTFFFDRLALADSLSGPFIALAIWASLRLFQHNKIDRAAIFWAFIGGLALTAAIFSKISNLIFLCLPLFAVILLPLGQWRRSILFAGSLYITSFVTLIPLGLLVKVLGQSDLGLDILTKKTAPPLSAIPQQVVINLGVLSQDIAAYLSFPLWVLVLIGLGVALWKSNRAIWLVTLTLVTTLASLIGRTEPSFLESRFLPVYAPLIATLTGVGLATASQMWNRSWFKQIMFGLSGAWLTVSGLMFAMTGWTQAEALPLPEDDRFQYIVGWPSGYGFRDLAHDFITQGESGTLVTLDLGGFQRFEAYLLGQTDQLRAKEYAPGQSWANAWLVLDRPKDDKEIKSMGWQLTKVARYSRPDDKSVLVVYRVEP